MDIDGTRSGERSSRHLGLDEKIAKRVPRDDRYYSEVIAVSLAKLFQSLCMQINGPNFFMLFGSCWEKVCQEHHMKRKVPLKVVLYKVSTNTYLSSISLCSDDDESFSRKVGSAAAPGDQSLWILCLRVHESVLKKN